MEDIECWIVDEQWQYLYVVAIALSLLFHYAVIVIAALQWRHYARSGFDEHFRQVVIKLLRFVVIYTLIRVFPIFDRMWQFTSSAPPPFGVLCAHHIAISLLGFSNAVVWRANQKQIPLRAPSKKVAQSEYQSMHSGTTTDMDYTTPMQPEVAQLLLKHQQQMAVSSALLPGGGVSAPSSRRGTLNEVEVTQPECDPESTVMWSLDLDT